MVAKDSTMKINVVKVKKKTRKSQALKQLVANISCDSTYNCRAHFMKKCSRRFLIGCNRTLDCTRIAQAFILIT